KQCSWEAWCEDFHADDDGQNCQRDEQARPMDFPKVLKREKQAPDESMPALLNPEHLGNFPESNLHTDARQKADKDGTRQKIGEKTQAKDAGQEKDAGSHESDWSLEGDITCITGCEY